VLTSWRRTASAAPSPTASASATPGGCVAQVNALCEALIEPVIAVNGGREPTFETYRSFLQGLDEKLATAAATGRQEDFDAAWAADKSTFDSSPFPKALRAAGIDCPAR
jgi:hypothetical protein